MTMYEKIFASEDELWIPHRLTSVDEESDTATLLPGKSGENSPSHSWRWSRSPLVFIIDLFLIALIVIFALREPRTSSWGQVGGDVTGYVPAFSEDVVVFNSHPHFISNHTSVASLSEARKHWMKLLPPGQGYIRVDDQMLKEFRLPKPVEYRGGKSLGTSMMHSLHCLWEIMSEYDMLALGLKKAGGDTTHMDHCFDYIRQMLMCGGDMALAGEDLPNGSSQLQVPHVCKSFDEMYQWLDEHKDNEAYQFGSAKEHFVPA